MKSKFRNLFNICLRNFRNVVHLLAKALAEMDGAFAVRAFVHTVLVAFNAYAMLDAGQDEPEMKEENAATERKDASQENNFE